MSAPLMLTVSGARGIVGRSMTPAVAAGFAATFATLVKESRGPSPLVMLGRDSRPSGEAFAAAAMSGLVLAGCRVVDLGVVATPTVGVMIGEAGADAGLVVTASHNPIEWNGIKCLDGDGVALAAPVAVELIERYRAGVIGYVPVTDLAAVRRDESGHETHVARVLDAVDCGPIRAAKFHVVLDSVNGGGAESGRMLLEALGCTVEHLNGEPTGRFAHVPEPIRENLVDLAEATAVHGAACGFAQDPDADRLAIVDERGRYIGEEYTLALAARRVLQVAGGGDVAANLSTSRMIDDVAAAHGSTVLRTPVGEANVVAAMRRAGAVIGGEGNGGVVFPPVCWVRDSLAAMALVLGLVAEEGRPLGAIVDDLPRYGMIKRKVDLADMGGTDAVPGVLAAVADHFDGAECRVNTADGVRVDLPDGWVHVRPSNTEPIARIIAEAETAERAETLAAEAAEAAGLVLA
ncbi:MAG: phosphoglucosamine mutase [Planctomycetes bacterium]|nr:phosphoglucosamine mutase [Planctomycetota bacterium]